MNGKSAPRNRHVVDQLADVREQIKQLEEREKDLKAEVGVQMGKADSLGGDEYIARQTITQRKGGLDDKAMKAAGIDVEKFRKKLTTVYSIRLEARIQEDA